MQFRTQFREPRGFLGRVAGRVMRVSNRPMNALALRYLMVHDDDRVLEIGFAHGALLERLLNQAVHGHVAGVEPSETMLEAGMGRFRDELATGRLDLRLGSVTALPFDDAQFDAVASVNTIYFWPDLESGLAEIRRVLRPGGRLVLVQRARSEDEQDYHVETDNGAIPTGDLVARIEAAGFTVRHQILRKVPFQMASIIAAVKAGDGQA